MTISGGGAERQPYCSFFVGQKVVCTQKLTCEWTETAPVIDGVYTIRSILAVDHDVGLRFVEIQNPEFQYQDGYGECAFIWNAFRPLTDISVFEAMLKTAPVDAPELEVAS